LPRPGRCHQPGGLYYRRAEHVVLIEGDVAGGQARPQGQRMAPCRLLGGHRRRHGAGGRGEGGQDAVAQRLDLFAAVTGYGAAEGGEVFAPQPVEGALSHAGQELRRSDQVGEEDGRHGVRSLRHAQSVGSHGGRRLRRARGRFRGGALLREGNGMKPRIAPGTRADIGLVNHVIARIGAMAAGTAAPPNFMTTLGRHRGLFRRWLLFAGGLMPGGKLPRRDTELVILRVAHLCDNAYERDHHERLAARAGLSEEDIVRVAGGPDAPGWTARQAALLRATDELHHDRRIGEETWTALRAHLVERDVIELCLLVGHYIALAGTLNSLGVQLDERR
jgi:alkylhydroperoxidase family enzyme